MKTACILLGLVAALATAACGDDTRGGGGSGAGGGAASTGGGTGETTSSAAGQGGSGGGGGDPGAGGGGGGGGEAPVTGPHGAVNVTTFSLGPDVLGTFLQASFTPEPECGPIETAGACALERCAPAAAYLDAGTLALSGGDLPAALGFDYLADLDGHLLGDGDAVAVTGPGKGDVPGFELGAAYPAPVAITEPSFADGYMDPSEDFAIAWTGGGDATMVVTVDGTDAVGGGEFDRVTCKVSAAAAALTIPGALMDPIAATSEALFIAARVVSTDRARAGDWTFDLAVSRFASAEGSYSGDASAYYEVELE